MVFKWDDRKAEQNVAKHSVPFEYAVRVFIDPRRLDREDARRNYGEERRLTLGEIEGGFLQWLILLAVKSSG